MLGEGGIFEDRVVLTTMSLEESQSQDRMETLRIEGDGEKLENLYCFSRRGVVADVGDPSGLLLILDMIVVMVVWSVCMTTSINNICTCSDNNISSLYSYKVYYWPLRIIHDL
jgi:hypothetical protein